MLLYGIICYTDISNVVNYPAGWLYATKFYLLCPSDCFKKNCKFTGSRIQTSLCFFSKICVPS